MFLKDNPTLMAEVEEKVKVVLGMRADTIGAGDAGEAATDD